MLINATRRGNLTIVYALDDRGGFGYGQSADPRRAYLDAYSRLREERNHSGRWTPLGIAEHLSSYSSHGGAWLLHWRGGRVSRQRLRR